MGNPIILLEVTSINGKTVTPANYPIVVNNMGSMAPSGSGTQFQYRNLQAAPAIYIVSQSPSDIVALAASETPSEIIDSITASITANPGGGQGSAVQLTSTVNNITTVATAGDSVLLPEAIAGLVVIIQNNGANAADVFPATGETINSGSANAAISIPAGARKEFIGTTTTNWITEQRLSTGAGTVSLPAITFDSDPDSGIYRIGANNIGVAVNGTKIVDVATTGATVTGLIAATTSVQAGTTVITDSITEKTSLANITANSAIIQKHATAAINSTGTASAANVKTGYITSTSAAATTITLPTGTDLGTALGAARGTVHELYIDNTAGSNTVTIAVSVNGILSDAATTTAASFGQLTVASGATGLARFTLIFSSATAFAFTRTA